MFVLSNPHSEALLDCVPPPTVAGDDQIIAYFFDQPSTFTLRKIGHE